MTTLSFDTIEYGVRLFREQRDTQLIGVSLYSELLPLHLFITNFRDSPFTTEVAFGDSKILIYTGIKVSLFASYAPRMVYNELYDAFLSSNAIRYKTLSYQNEHYKIAVMKGSLWGSDGKLLMALGKKTFDFRLRAWSKDEIKEDLILMVSQELLTNPIYTNFWKHVYKNLIPIFYDAQVEVRFIEHGGIEKVFYTIPYYTSFNSPEELRNILSNYSLEGVTL